jgi:hypothetical protein
MRCLVSILFTILGGILYACTYENFDPRFLYLFGFTIGFVAGKIQDD